MIGGLITPGNSKLLLNSVGVSDVFYKGWYLGKTNGGLTVNMDADYLDVIYQQEGTKKADEVMTGLMYTVTVPFAEINVTLLKLLIPGISSAVVHPGVDDDSMLLSRSLYQSRRENDGGVLKIAAVSANGVASEELEDILNLYEAVVKADGALLNYDAGSQRTLPVTFEVYWHRFTTPHSYADDGAFGYIGDPTAENVPAVVWPDVAAPVIQTAEATLATSLVITFDKDVAFQGGSYVNGIAVKVNEEDFIEPTGCSITDEVLTCTFAAESFAEDDALKLYITSGCIEDTEATANEYGGVDGLQITNSVIDET
jgi:hypothetical protein